MSTVEKNWPYISMLAWAMFVATVGASFLYYHLLILDKYSQLPILGNVGILVMLCFALAAVNFGSIAFWEVVYPTPKTRRDHSLGSPEIQESIELTGQ